MCKENQRCASYRLEASWRKPVLFKLKTEVLYSSTKIKKGIQRQGGTGRWSVYVRNRDVIFRFGPQAGPKTGQFSEASSSSPPWYRRVSEKGLKLRLKFSTLKLQRYKCVQLNPFHIYTGESESFICEVYAKKTPHQRSSNSLTISQKEGQARL